MIRTFIRKPCYCVYLHRYVEVGEIVEVPFVPPQAVAAGLVEIVPDVRALPDPDKIVDFGYRDKPVRYRPEAETR